MHALTCSIWRCLRRYQYEVPVSSGIKAVLSRKISNGNVSDQSLELNRLRDYQQEAIDACINAINLGRKRIGVSLATGSGKTVIFSNLIDQMRQNYGKLGPYKTLILVHRRELALQTVSTIKKFFPKYKVEIEMGKYHADLDNSDIIIGSVQTMIRRLDKYMPGQIQLLIIDEAHHAAAASYTKILEHFDVLKTQTSIPVVGFSATFERADRKALTNAFDEIVYHKGILEMIDKNWLCDCKISTIDIRLDFNQIETSNNHGKDFKIEGLSKVMNTAEINKLVLNTYQRYQTKNKLKSTLLFAVDVPHVKALHELFRDNGINSEYVTANTKEHHRDDAVNRFKRGEIDILMNCGIFTEGTDIPNIDSIMLCRPTKSRSLLVQMIGRGLRLHNDKRFCHIIDFGGGSTSSGVVTIPTLMGIDNTGLELDDATLEELEFIKKQIDGANRKTKELVDIQEEQKQEAANRIRKILLNCSTLDLIMISYDNIQEFLDAIGNGNTKTLEAMNNFERELHLLSKSNLPWVKFAAKGWALSLFRGNHLRIYKENQVSHTTVQAANTGIEESVKQTSKHGIYELRLYRENYSIHSERSGSRYLKPITLLRSHDLVPILQKVNGMITHLKGSPSETDEKSRLYNFTKFARWRKEKATKRQYDAIKKRLTCVDEKFATEEHLKNQTNEVDNYLQQLTKGEASDLLFATSIAPIYPLKSLLQMLRYRRRSAG